MAHRMMTLETFKSVGRNTQVTRRESRMKMVGMEAPLILKILAASKMTIRRPMSAMTAREIILIHHQVIRLGAKEKREATVTLEVLAVFKHLVTQTIQNRHIEVAVN